MTRAAAGGAPIAGVWDPLSARLAERAGFPFLFLGGFALSGTLLGQPDVGVLTQSEILDAARRIRAAVPTPLFVDGDTGHGGPRNVERLVRACVDMRAAGVFLEDQVWPKRCGHMKGKQVVERAEYLEKLAAAREARGDARLRIVARTDARAPLGLDEAIARGRAFAEAGADVVFVEAPQGVEELRRVAKEVPGPLLANVVDGGRTPALTRDELVAIGFEWLLYPVSALFAGALAMESAYRGLLETGRLGSVPVMEFHRFTALVGLEEEA